MSLNLLAIFFLGLCLTSADLAQAGEFKLSMPVATFLGVSGRTGLLNGEPAAGANVTFGGADPRDGTRMRLDVLAAPRGGFRFQGEGNVGARVPLSRLKDPGGSEGQVYLYGGTTLITVEEFGRGHDHERLEAEARPVTVGGSLLIRGEHAALILACEVSAAVGMQSDSDGDARRIGPTEELGAKVRYELDARDSVEGNLVVRQSHNLVPSAKTTTAYDAAADIRWVRRMETGQKFYVGPEARASRLDVTREGARNQDRGGTTFVGFSAGVALY